jgi:hypothetical protein
MSLHGQSAPYLLTTLFDLRGVAGQYKIDQQGLEQIASRFVEEMNRLDAFSLSHMIPDTKLTFQIISAGPGGTGPAVTLDNAAILAPRL